MGNKNTREHFNCNDCERSRKLFNGRLKQLTVTERDAFGNKIKKQYNVPEWEVPFMVDKLMKSSITNVNPIDNNNPDTTEQKVNEEFQSITMAPPTTTTILQNREVGRQFKKKSTEGFLDLSSRYYGIEAEGGNVYSEPSNMHLTLSGYKPGTKKVWRSC